LLEDATDVRHRFARQVKLAEIGARGQARIAAAEVTTSRGFVGWVEARYLVAAGVACASQGDQVAADPRFDSLDPAARDVALGAHAAVVALKKIIG
jgi:hypothetical protein